MFKLILKLSKNLSKLKMQPQQQLPKYPYKFYDIAANLTDDQFGGKYYDKHMH